jgi:hypothetical protein
MYFPKLEGFFAGPSLSYTLTDNTDISLFVQHFSGKLEQAPTGEDERQELSLCYLRLKCNF